MVPVLTIIAVGFAVVVAGLLIFIVTRPDSFRLERSAVIGAPAGVVFGPRGGSGLSIGMLIVLLTPIDLKDPIRACSSFRPFDIAVRIADNRTWRASSRPKPQQDCPHTYNNRHPCFQLLAPR